MAQPRPALGGDPWFHHIIFAAALVVSLLEVFEEVVLWSQRRATLFPVFKTLFVAMVFLYALRALLRLGVSRQQRL